MSNDDSDRTPRDQLFKPSVPDEVGSELAFHVEMRTRELIARGMDPARARDEAVKRFGDYARVQTTLERIGRRRDQRRGVAEWIGELRQDVAHGLRQLRHQRGFALLAILTLGIGIGATTAIFSAAYAVVLRPLPFQDPDRIVFVQTMLDGNSESVSSMQYMAWKGETRSFDRLAATASTNFTLIQGSELPLQLGGAFVSADFFPVFGVRPLLGRAFLPEEETPGRDQVAVLSHATWVEKFGADSQVIGRVVQLNSRPTTLIGVMPSSFNLSINSAELWAPLALDNAQRADNQKGWLQVIGRLRADVSPEQGTSDIKAVLERVKERDSQANANRTASLEPVANIIVGNLRERLFTLLGAVSLVLLIACTNVANLLLARGAARAREIAVRAAIGAGRGRIVRQLLGESLALGLLGGLTGLLLAAVGVRIIVALSPEGVPRLDQAGLDGPTVAFALLLSVTSTILFGLVPALRLARADLHSSLKEGGRSSGAGAVRDRVRRALVVTEVALSLVLLSGAGLLIRSAISLENVDPGFHPDGLFTAALSLPAADYPTPEAVGRAFRSIEESVRAVPGIESAALVFAIPMYGANAQAGINPEGRPLDSTGQMSVGLHISTPGIFEGMGIRVTAGRDFTDRDVVGSPRAAVLNETAAREAWPDGSALGRRFGLLRDSTGATIWWEVVGIVADVRTIGLRDAPRPQMYLPLAQTPAIILDAIQRTMFLVTRVRGEPLAMTNAVRAAVATVDPTLPLFAIGTMEERLASSLASTRFSTVLLSMLGVIGLALALVGIFGVISFFVSQRTREIGVRMALGATPSQVRLLVVDQGLRPVVLGVIVGLAGAAATTRFLQALLYDVSATDPLTLAGVAFGVLAVALVAALVPASRATRINPLSALRG
jgi:putative ABC transport system permease protein